MRKRDVIWRVFSICSLVILIIPAVFAATAGPQNPGTVVNDAGSGTQAWDNPHRAKASDDDRATVELDTNETSQYLKATNFSFSLPANAVVLGILVEVERRVSSTGGSGIVRDAAVRLVKRGIIGTGDRATTTAYTTTDTYESHGSSGDLWNTTWNASDINAVDFGSAIAVTNTFDDEKTARVDHVRIMVAYNTPPVITLLSPNGGEAWNGSHSILWNASDQDNDTVTITLQTSTDGTTWTAIAGSETNDGAYLWNTTTSPDNATYRVRAIVSDGSLTAQDDSNASFTINNTPAPAPDTTPPIITILGDNPASFGEGNQYADNGATAYDDIQGNITAAIAVLNTVNTLVPGTYAITYSINDSAGNNASAVRTVIVTDISQGYGLGPNEHSYFKGRYGQHQSGPSAPSQGPAASAPSSPAAEASSPAPASEGITLASVPSITGLAVSTESIAFSQPQTENTVSEAADTIATPITGAVAGKGIRTEWYWIASVAFLILLLLIAALALHLGHVKSHAHKRRTILHQLKSHWHH